MTTTPEVDLTQLYVTEKGLLHTNGSSSELKGRERQFLLLLLCGDSISQRACTGLLKKVDTDSLIARGFLQFKGQVAIDTTNESRNVTTSTDANTSTNASFYDEPSVANTVPPNNETKTPPLNATIVADDKNMDAIDPILQLAAGMATLPHSLYPS